MIFKKVILIRKNDRLTPPHLQRTPVFLRSQMFFSCDRRFARRFSFRFASGLLQLDLNFAKTRKQRRFFFLAVLVSRGEVSDVSRNIANSGPSKGGSEAKRELKRQRGCKNKKRLTPQRPQRLFRANGAWSRVILTFSSFCVKNLALVRKNDHSGQRLGPKNMHDTAATEPSRRLSLSHCSDLTASLLLRHLSRFKRLSKNVFRSRVLSIVFSSCNTSRSRSTFHPPKIEQALQKCCSRSSFCL